MPKLSELLAEIELPVWRPEPAILLCPRVPKPMHGLAPRVVLGEDWWNAERHMAYASTNNHCIACEVHRSKAKYHAWLEGHEVYKINYKTGRCKYLRTVPLCHACHNFIHCGRLERVVAAGKESATKLAEVLEHGLKIINAAGLRRPDPYEGPIARWSKWRLMIGKDQYPPLWKTLKDWCDNYGVSYEEAKREWFNGE